MTPYAGVGVNVAMQDALELAESITSAKQSCSTAGSMGVHVGEWISTAIENYEPSMLARAEENAKATWMYLNLFFNSRGGHAMVEHFANAKEQEAKLPDTKEIM